MFLYELARKANRKVKEEKKRRMGRFVSPVRRIERVHPVKGQRLCAMTFDDGPTTAPTVPDVSGGVPLTRHLIDTLKAYGATATFDVIGDTSENYPDERGEADAFYWGGRNFDHYPDFGADSQGGAKNCPELITYLLSSGFEISNHGYRHLIFGKSPVYNKRIPFGSAQEVLDDLMRLDNLLKNDHGYNIRLSRPPHYIDNIAGGLTSYDIYELMDYNYMAASFDGKGWMPQKNSFEEDVRNMVEPMRRLLQSDPDGLNGQIIFQKDGCNMSLSTPIAAALPLQLELLQEYGYRTCSVSELLSLSPFEDLSPDDECYSSALALENQGIVIGYKNNTLRPEEVFTFGELCMALCPPEERKKRVRMRMRGLKDIDGFALSAPYSAALAWAAKCGLKQKPSAPATGDSIARLLEQTGHPLAIPVAKASYSRREALCILASAITF